MGAGPKPVLIQWLQKLNFLFEVTIVYQCTCELHQQVNNFMEFSIEKKCVLKYMFFYAVLVN